ncbi:hypothetical protein L3V82_11875 [Thiotrichales bacterium 19S3-7]|nr:hypothetical protein [Thiotrichales bacterium 19S3-7]MCF6802792.1 hypothetical protein [Thiotrichales bacterium 19S3-11]
MVSTHIDKRASNGELDRKTQAMFSLLKNLRINIGFYTTIAKHANQIKQLKRNYECCLGFIQRMSLDGITLGLSKIYEKYSKRHTSNSIESILVTLMDSNNTNKHIDHTDFIKKYGSNSQCFICTTKDFINKQKKELELIRKMRNKVVAHSDFSITNKKNFLPSINDIDKLYNFALDFLNSVGKNELQIESFYVVEEYCKEVNFLEMIIEQISKE